MLDYYIIGLHVGQKKNCYIGVTRPTLKLGLTLHIKKKNPKKRQKNDQPILKKAKPVIFFLNILFWL